MVAETSLAAGLVRPAITTITASVAVCLLSLLIAYALPRSRSTRAATADVFMPLMLAAIFVFLPLLLLCLRSNIPTPDVALLMLYALAVLPFCIWQLRCSLNRIPPEVEEAAMIDGCSGGQLFRHVVLPIIAPSLVVTVLYSLIAAWSLCVVAPWILRIPGSAVLLPEANGFDPAAVCIAVAPLAVPFLFLSVYLVRNARASAQTGIPS